MTAIETKTYDMNTQSAAFIPVGSRGIIRTAYDHGSALAYFNENQPAVYIHIVDQKRFGPGTHIEVIKGGYVGIHSITGKTIQIPNRKKLKKIPSPTVTPTHPTGIKGYWG